MTTQQQRSEETSAQIMAAAEQCFARQGYDAASVADICAAAGVSKGAFYHHFDSKQALFLALLNRWLAGLDEQLARLQTTPAPAHERLLAMSALVGDVLAAAGDRLPIYLEFWNRAARDPQVRQATVAPYRQYREYFAGIIAEAVAAGELKPVPPDTVAALLVALAVGLLVQGIMDPQGADWNSVARQSMELMLGTFLQPGP